MMLMAFATIAFVFTACSNSSTSEEATSDVEEAVENAEADAEAAMEEAEAEVDEATASANFAWSAEFDEWVLNGSDAKTITLIDLGDEDAGITELGQAQLNYIATMLENNEGVNAVIKGHTDSDQKVGNGRGRAMWTKAKLILGHDAVASRISTEGVGTDEPLPGVDLADDSQKRVTVTFTK